MQIDNTVFIVVHGVGNPDKGVNRQTVESLLCRELNPATLDIDWSVREFHWNSNVAFPLEDRQLNYTVLTKIFSAWGSASRLRIEQGNPSRKILLSEITDIGLGLVSMLTAVYWLLLPILLLASLIAEIDTNSVMSCAWIVFSVIPIAAIMVMVLGLFAGQNLRELLRSLLLISLLPVIVGLTCAICWVRNPFPSSQDEGNLFLMMATVGLFFFWALFSTDLLSMHLAALHWPELFHPSKGITSAAVAIYGLLAFFGQKWVASVLKVVADIARYFGDGQYRDELQDAFDKHIDAYAENTRIVLLAHSLGSVIAIDSLQTGRCWTREHNVVLITAGSPLKRLIWRFFPGALPGGSPKRCLSTIQSRLGRFSWINCYRPWDQVGTSLGLTHTGVGIDQPTRQWWRLFSAHTNYWGDKDVLRLAFSRWNYAPTHQNQSKGAKSVRKSSYKIIMPFEKVTRKFLLCFLYALGVCIFVIVFGAFLKQQAGVFSLSVFADPSLSDGIVTTGSIEYTKRYNPGGGGLATWTHQFVVSWPLEEANGERTIELSQFYTNFHAHTNFRFDAAGLLSHHDCGTTSHCTISAVKVRYLSHNSSAFTLPNYPASFPRLRLFLNMLLNTFAGFFLGIMVGIGSFFLMRQYTGWLISDPGDFAKTIFD